MTRYADANTRILSPVGTQVDCSSTLPVSYQLDDGTYLCKDKEFFPCRDISIIEPSISNQANQLFVKIICFLYKIEFYMKNDFFWCIICWCRSKIAKFWNFTHFLQFLVRFSIFKFFCDLWKKNSPKGSNQLEKIQTYVETKFFTFWWLKSRETTLSNWPTLSRKRNSRPLQE